MAKTYDVMNFGVPFIGEEIIDRDALGSGFRTLLDGFGYSAVSDISIRDYYDIDRGENHILIECRCVKKRGLTAHIPNHINAVLIED